MLPCTIVLIIVLTSYSSANYLPADFPKCNRDNPNLGECLVKATEILKPQLQKGVREIELPPLDPFVVPQLTLQQGSSAIKYKIDLTNVTINGLEDYKFRKLDFDSENYILNGIVAFEKLFVRANYDFDGKILLAPLKGTGVVKAFTGPTTAIIVLKGELKEQNGQRYVKPKDARVSLEISNSDGYFDGLINDKAGLSEMTNRILNENAHAILHDAVPLIELGIRKILLDIWDKTIGQVPYDEILPLSS